MSAGPTLTTEVIAKAKGRAGFAAMGVGELIEGLGCDSGRRGTGVYLELGVEVFDVAEHSVGADRQRPGRAAKMTAEERSEAARKAAKAR